ncbi:MAG: iron-sulfur cluster assembly accessory protein [DPANN group archaeon]|nr:iron-sulfur cluster assembly accessory protein [DPANN group archaeon]
MVACEGTGTVTEVTPRKSESSGIELTNFAIEKVKFFMQKENGKYLRVAVLPGGCAGFSYDFAVESAAGKDDLVFDFKGLNILVSKFHLPMLKGSKINYAETIQGSGLVVDNPNATKGCGCGHSFG